ncbi:AlbA family DNA-binding domain-containing protein [Streptomyces sp. NBC_00696]|uniref:AlbA family DNA-binding domain-containing protein n=1 Tax=Streptomyces sp. NBC_00696 TaxID=2903672 RepID=UPI002E340DE8|nr:ATP-binding protein [Streptomyces sp. NBC_00696]
MPYTSLHRSVGSPPGPVTAELLAQAVAIRLGEAEDLDWKKDADDVKDNRETAKDFAALANAHGGIIVTGIEEDGADHAAQLLGVDDERARSLVARFRSVAASLVRPFIPAFKVYSVRLPDSPGRSAVVVEVPRSPEAPHLVMGEREAWRYPKRVATDTVWLGESELEAAYGRRFALRQDAQTRLQGLTDELRHRLRQEHPSVWVAVTAVPSVPAPLADAPTINPSASDPVLSQIFLELPDRSESLLRTHLTHLNPVVGLRRSIFTNHRPYTGQSARAHLELHHDGSFAGALNGSSRRQNEPTLLSQFALESTVRDLTTAAAWNADLRGADGTLQLMARIIAIGPMALAERDGDIDEQIDGSLVLDGSIPAQTPTFVTTEAPISDLVALPQR